MGVGWVYWFISWFISWLIDWLIDWLIGRSIAGRDEDQETREGAGSQVDDWLRGCSRTGSTKEKAQAFDWGEQRTLNQGLALDAFTIFFHMKH